MNFTSVRLVYAMRSRRPYAIDISDEEWAFAAPCLTLMDE